MNSIITFASIRKSAKKSAKKSARPSSLVVELQKDGTPFYMVLTNLITSSSNEKTGDMIQSYFLRKDEFISSTGDVRERTSNLFGFGCDTCPAKRHCYVSNTTQTKDKGLGSVRRTLFKLLRGEKTSYQFVSFSHAVERVREAGKKIRLGTYGDPTALQVDQIQKLVSAASGHTGYTHYWRRKENRDYSRFLMASCETSSQQARAEKYGFRAFLALPENTEIPENTVICPNYTQGISCLACGLCDGKKEEDTRRSIVIELH